MDTYDISDVLREPDRDEWRLRFADWLYDQGEYDRAEFIRTGQI